MGTMSLQDVKNTRPSDAMARSFAYVISLLGSSGEVGLTRLVRIETSLMSRSYLTRPCEQWRQHQVWGEVGLMRLRLVSNETSCVSWLCLTEPCRRWPQVAHVISAPTDTACSCVCAPLSQPALPVL